MSEADVLLLCLDFDGVVLESNTVRDAAWSMVFSDQPAPVRKTIVAFHRANPGIDRADKMRRIYVDILRRIPAEEELSLRLAGFRTQCESSLMTAPPVSGIEALLEEVDVPVYVLTAAREDEVSAVCSRRGLTSKVTGIRGGPTRKEQHVRSLLNEHMHSPGQVLMVGDQISDWRVSHLVGCRFVGRNAPDRPASFCPEVPIIDDLSLGWGN